MIQKEWKVCWMKGIFNIIFGEAGSIWFLIPIFYHIFCLNNFLQVWCICNKIYEVPLFRYINCSDKFSCLVRGSKVLGDMQYLTGSVKWAAEAVVIWTEGNWDEKRVNSLYTMVSSKFNFKRNKIFDSLIWSSVGRDFYTRRGYIIGELNEEQEQAW